MCASGNYFLVSAEEEAEERRKRGALNLCSSPNTEKEESVVFRLFAFGAAAKQTEKSHEETVKQACKKRPSKATLGEGASVLYCAITFKIQRNIKTVPMNI